MEADLGAADFAVVAGEVARLIELRDDTSTEIAEDAKAGLISIGGEVAQPLAAAVGSLDRYGQLSAIEVFEHIGDAAAGPALIDLLGSEHDTVREWSAWAIADLGIREAVPRLRAAYQRLRVSGGRLPRHVTQRPAEGPVTATRHRAGLRDIPSSSWPATALSAAAVPVEVYM